MIDRRSYAVSLSLFVVALVLCLAAGTVESEPPEAGLEGEQRLFDLFEIPNDCRDEVLLDLLEYLVGAQATEVDYKTDQLLDYLSGGLASSCFAIEPWLDDEMISERKGSYYTVQFGEIDTDRARYKDVVHFDCGHYTIDHSPSIERLRSSVTALTRILKKVAQYRIYLRGSADIGGGCPVQQAHPQYTYSSIQYLQKDRNAMDMSRYHPPHANARIALPIINAHLPVLRAAFVKDILGLPVVRIRNPPEILESEVTSNLLNPGDRHVVIFLFIDTQLQM
jgi:hypothetical protein